MTTRDMFLDALTVRAPRAADRTLSPTQHYVPPSPAASSQLERDLAAARAENERLKAAKAPPPPPVTPRLAIAVVGPNYKPGTRPSFADDIDAMVRNLVDAGEIALDVETDTYRTTRYRHLRFSGVA